MIDHIYGYKSTPPDPVNDIGRFAWPQPDDEQ